MPLKGFICPKTNQKIPFSNCHSCENPCLPLPVLIAASEVREIKLERLHVTQILTPAWQLYLMATNDYYESPFDLFYKMYGSSQHYFLQKAAESKTLHKNTLVEKHIDASIGKTKVVGMLDYYDGLYGWLWDYKTYGNYKVVKCKEDMFTNAPELVLQVNLYKYLSEKCFPDISIKRLKCLALVRDWRPYEYKQVLENNKKAKAGLLNKKGFRYEEKVEVNCMEIMEIPILRTELLLETINKKIDDIFNIFDLKQGICPEEERWDDKRCLSYCSCKDVCPYGQTLS